MVKGRKLTTSRSERLLGSYGDYQGHENGGDGSELKEDDVWRAVHERAYGDDHDEWSSRATTESNGRYNNSTCNHHPPRADQRRQLGGLSLAFDDSADSSSSKFLQQQQQQQRGQDQGVMPTPRGRKVATSAPVNVPDWSKIYKAEPVESLHESDDESEWLPPHEYLARVNARARSMAPNSVFEGAGRTLKGRDLSRVRDAVWSRTGFDG